MKRLKKIISIFMILLTIMSVFMISVSARVNYTLPLPENTQNYPYYVVFNITTGSNPNYVFYSSVPGTLNEDRSKVSFDGPGESYISSQAIDNWAWSQYREFESQETMLSPGAWQVLVANYSIGDYEPKTARFIYPEDGVTVSINPHVEFELLGGLTPEEVYVKVKYTGQDGSISWFDVESVDYDETPGHGVIHSSYSVPWGTGVNVVYICSDLLMTEVYDTLTINFGFEQPSGAHIMGLENNASYEVPPHVFIRKYNYPDAVGYYVNDEKYQEIRKANGDTNLWDFWTDNLKLGLNTIELRNMRTSEVIENYTITITKGYIDSSGNYFNDAWRTEDGEDGRTPSDGSGITDILNNPPAAPGEGATIFDWVKYIADMINYFFHLAIKYIGDFAKSVGRMLVSLFGMITPVFSFLNVMFNSLPGQISTGLFALFALAVLLTIFRLVRRG